MKNAWTLLMAGALVSYAARAEASDFAGSWTGTGYPGGYSRNCKSAAVDIVIKDGNTGTIDIAFSAERRGVQASRRLALNPDGSFTIVDGTITISGKLTATDGTFDYKNTKGCSYTGSLNKAPG